MVYKKKNSGREGKCISLINPPLPKKILDAAVTNKTFKNVIEHHRGSLQP